MKGTPTSRGSWHGLGRGKCRGVLPGHAANPTSRAANGIPPALRRKSDGGFNDRGAMC